MRADDAQGVLAIWNDVREGREVLFEHWYNTEHFPERLAVPGFRLGRRYEALDGAPRYFCAYFTDTPETLTSPAYLGRLNDPTPLTRQVMTEAFANMTRTMCRRAVRFGALMGAFCVTARFDQPLEEGLARDTLAALAETDGVARCELWLSAEPGGAREAAAEEKLRGPDRKIAACAIVETVRAADAMRVRGDLSRAFGARAEVGIYRLLCLLAAA